MSIFNKNNSPTVKISLGLAVPLIAVQLNDQKINFHPDKIKEAEGYLSAINSLRMGKIINERTARKAYLNLEDVIKDAIIL